MTNAEIIATIRAEIERRYNKHKYSTAITEMVYAEEDEQILSFLDTLQEPEQTCKTCGFYENNCPFIRGKFVPYPNKVCKDYTYSVMKAEQELGVDLDDEIERRYDQAKWGYVDGFGSVCMDKGQFTRIARHFYNLGKNAK